MKKFYSQKEKALVLGALHGAGEFLVLPNVWDVLGAKLLEDMGYPAVATASAAIAYSNGLLDGEHVPFNELCHLLSKIVNGVRVPVTADIEGGFAEDAVRLKENMRAVIKTGVAGINIEDTNHAAKRMYSLEEQCERIRLIRAVGDELDVPLFINARCDVLLQSESFFAVDGGMGELVKRSLAYKNAGADCFFPIGLRQKESMAHVVSAVKMPVNILILAGVPELEEMRELGVRRVSLGPSFLKTAIQGMKLLATRLKGYEGLKDITENEISSDYLKKLTGD